MHSDRVGHSHHPYREAPFRVHPSAVPSLAHPYPEDPCLGHPWAVPFRGHPSAVHPFQGEGEDRARARRPYRQVRRRSWCRRDQGYPEASPSVRPFREEVEQAARPGQGPWGLAGS